MKFHMNVWTYQQNSDADGGELFASGEGEMIGMGSCLVKAECGKETRKSREEKVRFGWTKLW